MYEKLKLVRREKKITCEEMAHELGLKTRGAYGKKENGMVPFTLEEAKKVASKLSVAMDYIFLLDSIQNGNEGGEPNVSSHPKSQ